MTTRRIDSTAAKAMADKSGMVLGAATLLFAILAAVVGYAFDTSIKLAELRAAVAAQQRIIDRLDESKDRHEQAIEQLESAR